MFESDFTREFMGEVLLERVNFSRATTREALLFKERILDVILRGHIKIIIDLSFCSFIDSTFLGALVLIHKRLKEKGGELKIIKPNKNIVDLFEHVGLYKLFNSYPAIDDAIKSFAISESILNEQ